MKDKNTHNLKQYSHNVYSQNGEDGILDEIIKRLNFKKNKSNWCVEFGAWDGIYLSNTFNLVKSGWNAIYIEGDKNKFKDLLKTKAKNPKITAINKYVSKERSSILSLDNILKSTDLPKDFEVLSIDIDSFDLEVWEAVSTYSPKIVVIEINSAYLPGIIKWHSGKNSNVNGNSFSATLKVGRDKGYELICHTGNMIFLRQDLIDKIKIDQRFIDYPELLYDDTWYSIEKNKLKMFLNRFLAFLKVKIIKKVF